ncbi:ATP-dependent Clp protease ATP-binding subunit [soil metagenome]
MSNINQQLRRAFSAAITEGTQIGRDYIDSATVTLGILQEANSKAASILVSQGLNTQGLRSFVKTYPAASQRFAFDLSGLSGNMGQGLIDGVNKAFELANKYSLDALTAEALLLSLLTFDNNLTLTLAKAGLNKERLEAVKRALEAAFSGNGVEGEVAGSEGKPDGSGGFWSKVKKKTMLEQFTTDLTALARAGKLSPVIGRLPEITKVIQILGRKTKSNPILIGEPGVGKTAVAEGIAQRIALGNVPKRLLKKRLLRLDLVSMLAGAKMQGAFEERLLGVLKEIKEAGDVVLFSDEIHTLIGAGAAPGGMDAANALKPALANGEVSCIGATTMNEYRKYVEKDPALTRRFRVVMLVPPSVTETIQILQGLREGMEKHHGVTYSDEALRQAAEMAERYVTDRFQPDKAIDLIDEAGSKLAIDTDDRDPKLPPPEVNGELIAEIVSAMTGIPVSSMNSDEKQRLKQMDEILSRRIIGQKSAVAVVSRAIKRGRVGMKDPNRPIGSFLFLGPTGVGKTEVTKALQEFLNGNDHDLARFDMSEYMERHSVSKLIGAPPGYVGYEEGGTLTEAVRRKPYSVVLFDEIEKAHHDVYNVLLQVLDDGRLTDGKGRTVDFRNTIIILTSNIGARKLQVEYKEDAAEKIYDSVMADVRAVFNPEFINRLDEVVCFNQLTQVDVNEIFHHMAAKVLGRLPQNLELKLEQSAIDFICARGFDPVYGARPMRRAVTRYLEDPITDVLLEETQGGDLLIARAVDDQIEIEHCTKTAKPQ